MPLLTYRNGIVRWRHRSKLDIPVEAAENSNGDSARLTRFKLIADRDVDEDRWQYSSDVVGREIVHSVGGYIRIRYCALVIYTLTVISTHEKLIYEKYNTNLLFWPVIHPISPRESHCIVITADGRQIFVVFIHKVLRATRGLKLCIYLFNNIKEVKSAKRCWNSIDR